MNVEKLTCFHFRNYETMSFSFVPKCIHFLYGKNAQGKTNLIEAIYFLSHLRSFRTNQMDSMIMHGCNEFCVQAIVESNHRKEELKVMKAHLHNYPAVLEVRHQILLLQEHRLTKIQGLIRNLQEEEKEINRCFSF